MKLFRLAAGITLMLITIPVASCSSSLSSALSGETNVGHGKEVRLTPSSRKALSWITVGNFNTVITNSIIDVIYTPGAKREVSIQAPENILPYVEVKVKNGKLTADFNHRITSDKGFRVVVNITAPAVSSLITNSAGDITITNDLSSNSPIELITNSAGDITTKRISCPALTIYANSVGDIKIEGISADRVEAAANSAGDINIYKSAKADQASFAVNSAGDIRVNGLDATDVSLASTSKGDINASGKCINLMAAANSAGNINAPGLTSVNAMATTSSLGDITIYATTSAMTRQSSAGKIKVLGKAKIKKR